MAYSVVIISLCSTIVFGGVLSTIIKKPADPKSFDVNQLPKPVYCGAFLTNHIIGGGETEITDYPWLALIQFYEPKKQSEGFHCGGTLINQNYVLTAAHCIKGKDVVEKGWKIQKVRLGEWRKNSDNDYDEDLVADPPANIEIAETIVHEGYRNTSLNRKDDIALIRLARPTQFTYFIKPLCLPNVSAFNGANFGNETTFVAAGWGATETGGESEKKLHVQLDGVSHKKCREMYLSQRANLTDKQICAGGEPGRDTCKGDSGGPLMKMDLTNRSAPFMFIAGITSFGKDKCGTPGWPSVYTRVDKYMDWILKNMRP